MIRPTFPYPIVETKLDNGLPVVAIPLDTPGLIAHYVAVRTGSRNEIEPGLTGFAHFFEHMMFRGTPRFSPERYNDVLKRLGADGNAFTTDDWTCYHVTAASEALETIMDLEADRFMHLRYDVEAFQKEAGAVLGEYNKNYSIPFNALFEKLADTAYTTHTYKHTTMGFLRDIETMPQQYDYSLKFFDRWYRPDNAVLVVAGDCDPERVFELARRHYGPWRAGAASLRTPAEPPQDAERTAHLPWAAPTLPLLAMAFHAPAFDPGAVEVRALDVLAQACFAPTSPLYRELVLERQWVDWLAAGAEDHRDPTLFLVLARVKEAAHISGVRAAIERTLASAADAALPEERLAAVRSRLRYGFLSGLMTPDQVANTVCHFFQLSGTTGAIDRSFATLDDVAAADLVRAAGTTFRAENRTVVTLIHS
ncbi:MAG TPA: pitrilysin family protein [Candidatus Polarisedimenticolaceae bacterium]|nr:pitrilysin family protein [Candidatus Polarisedimenticolaceae bacterium]